MINSAGLRSLADKPSQLLTNAHPSRSSAGAAARDRPPQPLHFQGLMALFKGDQDLGKG